MLNWQSDRAPLSDDVVAGAELILGVRLPEAYRALAQRWPGGRPDRSDFVVNANRGTWGSCVGVLLSLDPRDTENVFECIRNLAVDDQLPAGLVPITDDGGGDLLCLDYRSNPAEPAVVYWAHELEGEDAVVPVAPSFAAFLTMLDEEATAGEDDEDRG